jgi:hypothetical protein
MEQIKELINFVNANLLTIWTILTSVITIASVIVKLTPTDKDNKILNGLVSILAKIALNKNLPEIKVQ